MIAHHLTRNPSQRLVDRGELSQHVGAVSLLLDHLLEPAHLAFDAAEALEAAILDLGIDAGRVTPAVVRAARALRAGRGAVSLPARPAHCTLPALRHDPNLLNRKLFPTTLTELIAIAALASTGLSRNPNAGYSAPAATGMPT